MTVKKRIYLDNAATSFPKAPGTGDRVRDFLENSVSLYRTESSESEALFNSIDALRRNLNSVYNGPGEDCIAFTMNVTEALNLAISGLLEMGDHAIISSHEHNAVMRPLCRWGIRYSKIPSDRYGFNDYSTLDSLLTEKTKAVIINAAGNVSGAIQDLTVPSEFARKHNLMLLIDSAQASPFHRIDMTALDATAVCFTGHKGFLGPEGTGGILLRRDPCHTIKPLTPGGTGSESDNECIPSSIPDRLTGGTENYPGLVGLSHSLSYVLDNLETLKRQERQAVEKLYEGIRSMDGIRIEGAPLDSNRTNVISISSSSLDIADLSYLLLSRGGIETRVGLHCAPSSHRALGTYPEGTLRFSPGPFTTSDEIDVTLRILKECVNELL